MLELQFYVDGEEKTLALSDTEIRFGRSGENEVVLPDYSVSRRHASIRRENDSYFIVDQQSTNGVQLNGQSVERGEIRAGDQLKIGVFEVQVVDRSSPGARPMAPIPPSPVPPVPPAPPPAVPNLGGYGAPPGSFGSPEAQPPVAPPGPSIATQQTPVPAGPDSGQPFAPRPATDQYSVFSGSDSAISNATIVRSLADFSEDYGLLDSSMGLGRDSSAIRASKREALDQAYASQVFGFLTRLARLLINNESDDAILRHVMSIAFDAFPVDRGFILMREDSGDLACELMRINEREEFRPQSEVPISKTMLEAVMNERVALLTYDALSDRRLAGTESVRIHQIRAAMCAPLWAGEKIIGVIQLDTPHHTGTFTEPDVDLLATLANYCAVAIERNRNARDAEFQREVRNRLSRYHSPAVIEEVMQEGSMPEGNFQKLKEAEVSVLFADIVGFTAFSEKAAPEEVAALMEGYFTHAVEAIFSYGGTLDKFIGDCVMAFFGAPMQQEDHAYRAVAAAVEVREAIERWNAERESEGQVPVRYRIGINSGPVVVGDIGSNRRVDYTVLGNTVNVASRLEESVAKAGDIVLGDTTFQQLDGRIPTEPLGQIQLKGLSRKIVAHKVL